MAPKKKPTVRNKPGIGGGARGQRLAAGATAAGVTPGAYNSGTTAEQTARNTYINTLSEDDKMRYMNQTGYWTGGVPTKTPKVSKAELRRYGTGNTSAGTYQYQSSPGVYAGSVTVDAQGQVTGTSALRATGQHRKPKEGRGRKGTHDKVLGGVTNESISSSAQTDAAVANSFAEADLTRTGTAAAQGKAYEYAFGTDAGTVLHAGDYVPSSAQTAAGASTGGGGKPKHKKPGKKPKASKLKKRPK